MKGGEKTKRNRRTRKRETEKHEKDTQKYKVKE